MQMRKCAALSVLVSVLLLLALTACGGGSGSSTRGGGTPPPAATEFVIVGNAGGGVSSFGIDSTTGVLTQVTGSPFQAGTGVNRLALDPSGKVVYATQIAGAPNVQSFTVGSTGILTVSASSSFSGLPGTIAIHPTGKFAYILPDSASTSVGTVSAFSIDPTTHGLTALAGQPSAVAGVGRSLAIDSSGKYLYIVFPPPGQVTGAVAGRIIDPISGTLTDVSTSPFILSGQDSRQIAITAGNIVLVTNFATNNISVLTLEPATGILTPAAGSPVGTGIGPVAVATDSLGKFAFVVNQTSNNISVFSITGSTLTPVPGSPFATGTNSGATPNAIAVDPSNAFVYVITSAGTSAPGTISAFTLNNTSGALTPIAGSPFVAGTGPQSLVVAKP